MQIQGNVLDIFNLSQKEKKLKPAEYETSLLHHSKFDPTHE